MRRTIRSGSFAGQTDQGTPITINVVTQMFDDVVLSKNDLITADGQWVNRIAKGHYQIVFQRRSVDVRSNDPAAP